MSRLNVVLSCLLVVIGRAPGRRVTVIPSVPLLPRHVPRAMVTSRAPLQNARHVRAPVWPRPVRGRTSGGVPLKLRAQGVGSGPPVVDGAPSDVLSELVELAASGDDAALAAKVEADFSSIGTETVAELQTQIASGSSPAQLVADAVQAAATRRLEVATGQIKELIENTKGDVNACIQKLLKEAESPLPLLMVLQLNIGQANFEGDEDKARALMHIHSVMNEELEKKAPRVQALLNKLMRMEDEGVRNNLLRHHLEPVEVAAPGMGDDGPTMAMALVRPTQLSAAITTLVESSDQQMKATVGEDDELRFETMDKIRRVAIEARAVVGEVCGQAEMDQFSEDLTPTFAVFTENRARRLAASGNAPEAPTAAEAAASRDTLRPPPESPEEGARPTSAAEG